MNALRASIRDLLLEEPPVPRIHTGPVTLPVPAFGAFSPGIDTATLAWNPSYEEVRKSKVPVLSDFGVSRPAELTPNQLEKIELLHSAYFRQPSGPTAFFQKLGPLVAAAGRSFESGDASHLDLSPWPTEERWRGLAPAVRNDLLIDGVIRLVNLLKLSGIKRLFVNGSDVYADLRKGLELARRLRGPTLGDACTLSEVEKCYCANDE